MKLIIESSSSRTEWCLIEGKYIIDRVFTDGINPYFQSRKEISRLIRLQLPESFFQKKIENIFYYGAGCKNEDKKNIVCASLTTQFKTNTVVESDLIGAAISLFQEDAGIACILGSGSNSCFYDGNSIVKNVEPLGYILGDEGSGAALGKMFLSDCLKGLADPDVTRAFFLIYRTTTEEVLDLVYSKPRPGIFLSSLSPFLANHINTDYVYDLVKRCINLFFQRNLLLYEFEKYPIAFVGSIAYQYQDIVKELGAEYGLQIKEIRSSAMEGLVKYHTRHLSSDII